ncbi:MAG: cytochrome c [Acidobacteriaceae bacterium]|nr:cytochrome c [Acidobacteriaceae bacterium]
MSISNRAAPFLVLLLVVLALTGTDRAHDVITTKLTYSREISRIFLNRCAGCHGPGASIDLSSYRQVRPWAVDVKEQVLSRQMPPWGAVKGFGNLSPDHALSEEEILMVAAWVVGGAPEGDPKLLPKESEAAAPVASDEKIHQDLVAESRLRLPAPLSVIGIRPLPVAPVESARVTARLPSGEIVPLVWLYRFDATQIRNFTFRDPLPLPAGTVVESSAPLRFALLERRD